jgi:hypothetical protein
VQDLSFAYDLPGGGGQRKERKTSRFEDLKARGGDRKDGLREEKIMFHALHEAGSFKP